MTRFQQAHQEDDLPEWWPGVDRVLRVVAHVALIIAVAYLLAVIIVRSAA